MIPAIGQKIPVMNKKGYDVPTIVDYTSAESRGSPNLVIDHPSNIKEGDYLFLFYYESDRSSSKPTISGWTKNSDYYGSTTFGIVSLYKQASGNESGSLSLSNYSSSSTSIALAVILLIKGPVSSVSTTTSASLYNNSYIRFTSPFSPSTGDLIIGSAVVIATDLTISGWNKFTEYLVIESDLYWTKDATIIIGYISVGDTGTDTINYGDTAYSSYHRIKFNF